MGAVIYFCGMIWTTALVAASVLLAVWVGINVHPITGILLGLVICPVLFGVGWTLTDRATSAAWRRWG